MPVVAYELNHRALANFGASSLGVMSDLTSCDHAPQSVSMAHLNCASSVHTGCACLAANTWFDVTKINVAGHVERAAVQKWVNVSNGTFRSMEF